MKIATKTKPKPKIAKPLTEPKLSELLRFGRSRVKRARRGHHQRFKDGEVISGCALGLMAWGLGLHVGRDNDAFAKFMQGLAARPEVATLPEPAPYVTFGCVSFPSLRAQINDAFEVHKWSCERIARGLERAGL